MVQIYCIPIGIYFFSFRSFLSEVEVPQELLSKGLPNTFLQLFALKIRDRLYPSNYLQTKKFCQFKDQSHVLNFSMSLNQEPMELWTKSLMNNPQRAKLLLLQGMKFVIAIFTRERPQRTSDEFWPFWTYLPTHVRCFLYYAYYLSPIFAEIPTYPKIGRPL